MPTRTVVDLVTGTVETIEMTPEEIVANTSLPLSPAEPASVEPVRIACALLVPVVDGEVQTVGGAYRIAAMLLLDIGVFLAVFSQNLGSAHPYLIPNNGIHASIAEWGEEFAVIEVRDHAGGSLITPSSFGFSLYNI